MKRLEALDAARFLAYCGMVLVNFRIAAQVAEGTDWASVLINALEGRAAALFVVLAGIGIGLSKISAHVLMRRAAFLFALGLLNMIEFEADILHFYALYFMVGTMFLTAERRALCMGAIGVIFISTAAHLVVDYDRGWNWDTLNYYDLWSFPGFIRNLLFNGWHPVFPWAAFLLIGMAIARTELHRPGVQNRLIIWGFGAAIFATFPARLVTDPDLVAVLGAQSLPPGPFYVLAGTGTACIVIGILLKLWPTIDRLRIGAVLSAPGRQSLTLYMSHILLGMGLLEATGRLNGSLSAPQVFFYAVTFCTVSSVFALLWSRKFKQGPLEALMRLLTEPSKNLTRNT
ncbi:DUF418 domain-containing protein [Ruegeria arenilitoris]|uniref:DUF418 domain-containing protein n=1 Tax=Ruegeria arenilitoris TaxID=1173585 RepID=UPI00147A7F0B|nr:DUF418 domain-containing protein [Ruegeria arenilitoris]